MGKAFQQEKMKLPSADVVTGFPNPLPYYLVGDEIFGLKTWLMKPYSGRRLPEEQNAFNYRLSRARRVIENAFGILRLRWKIYSRPIKGSVENIIRYVLATLCLHNYLSQTENASYCAAGFVDSENSSGKIKDGEWRSQAQASEGSLREIEPSRGNRYNLNALEMRKALENYVNSDPW